MLAFWEYAFQPSGFHYGPISWPRSAEAPSYEVSPSLKLAVIQFAVVAINQNLQSRFSADDANPNESNRRFAQLYSVIQQLLPDIAVSFRVLVTESSAKPDKSISSPPLIDFSELDKRGCVRAGEERKDRVIVCRALWR